MVGRCDALCCLLPRHESAIVLYYTRSLRFCVAVLCCVNSMMIKKKREAPAVAYIIDYALDRCDVVNGTKNGN